ncbi:MAG TPA: hypothetical protein P5081_16640 [Phycisphaerae bacterium]|mgnify:CR=1 FL=1|nr:hypothetical protein [Phycisphaerae bacterium]HRW54499.1 hypothetical protein [Phycisphaerae bacterium]
MLFPQVSPIQKLIHTRSLSMLGIVCLLVMAGMGLAPPTMAPPVTPMTSAPTSASSVSRPAKPDRHRPAYSTSRPANAQQPGASDRMPTSGPDPHRLPRSTNRNRNRRLGRPTSRPAPIRNSEPENPEASEPIDYGDTDVVELPTGEKAYRLRYKLPKRETRYLTIENDFRDRGGIPGLLTYSAEAGCRITLEQKWDDAGKSPARRTDRKETDDSKHTSSLSWRVQRYEARDRALGTEHRFDTLRDAYPVAAMRRLGTANGAVVNFERDAWSGVVSRLRIQPGRSIGPATRLKLSKTTQKCLLDNDHLNRLFDDIGPLILPRTPRKVGETWTRTRDRIIKNFGKSVTTYRLTLNRVTENGEGDLLAEVDIRGGVELRPDPIPPANPIKPKKNAAPRNGKKPRRPQNNDANKRHEFELDSATINGAFVFNITQGMLVDMTLRRESAISADMESEQMGEMSLENSEAHTLRVRTSTEAPAMPIIVGGPKPPKDDPADLVRAPTRTPTSAPATNGAGNAAKSQDRRALAKDYAERRRQALERLEKRRQEAMKRRGLTTQPATSQPASETLTPSKIRPPAKPIPRELTSRPAPVRHPAVRARPLTTQPADDSAPCDD